MPLPSHLEIELRKLLRQFRAAHGTASVPSGAGKALEAWLVMKLAEQAAVLGSWTVTLRQGDTSALPSGAAFRLPSQPTAVGPSHTTSACYVLFEHRHDSQYSLELHGSLQWRGRSGAVHEFDVSAIPSTIANRIRLNGGGYPHGLPIAALECKDKTSDAKLDEAREKLARMFDVVLVTSPKWGMECRIYEKINMTHWGIRFDSYIKTFQNGLFGIVRAKGFQSGATTLCNHYNIKTYGNICTTRSTSVTNLLNNFRETLDDIDKIH